LSTSCTTTTRISVLRNCVEILFRLAERAESSLGRLFSFAIAELSVVVCFRPAAALASLLVSFFKSDGLRSTALSTGNILEIRTFLTLGFEASAGPRGCAARDRT
jgi:hypothetical protein